METIIGCSGFSYKEWKNIFYPEKLAQSKWFGYYCEHFNTLELNVTFYRFPEIKTLQGWYNKSPQAFRFAVKAPRGITHYKRLKGAEQLIKDFYTNCQEGLQEKLGPLLFQFPPTFIYNEENLSLILQNLDNSFINIAEFRHSSWWNANVYSAFQEHHITFCGINHPTLPNEVIKNTPILYYRFHGVPNLFYSEYDEKTLEDIAIKVLHSGADRAYFYFNNTASVAAIKNARWLQQYFEKK